MATHKFDYVLRILHFSASWVFVNFFPSSSFNTYTLLLLKVEVAVVS